MDEVSRKIIIEKSLASLGFVVLIGWLHFFSWYFFLSALALSVISLVSGIYGNRYRNHELSLLHHLSIMLILGLLGVRSFTMSLYMPPFGFWLGLAMGIIFVSVLPFMNGELSKHLYDEQIAPKTFWGQSIMVIVLIISFIATGLHAYYLKTYEIAVILAGYWVYLAVLGGLFLNFHRYRFRLFRWL